MRGAAAGEGVGAWAEDGGGGDCGVGTVSSDFLWDIDWSDEDAFADLRK